MKYKYGLPIYDNAHFTNPGPPAVKGHRFVFEFDPANTKLQRWREDLPEGDVIKISSKPDATSTTDAERCMAILMSERYDIEDIFELAATMNILEVFDEGGNPLPVEQLPRDPNKERPPFKSRKVLAGVENWRKIVFEMVKRI